MVCTNCGQGINRSSGLGSGCCNLDTMDVVTPLNKIRNGNEDFCFTEITSKICENLMNDEGINPSVKHSNTDCEDLAALNDLATGDLHNALMVLNVCDVNEYKCWLDSLLSWQWNVDKGIVCAICGLWTNIHNLWEKIDNLEDQINQIQQSITINGKIEVPREVPVNKGLVTPVDLGKVTADTRIAITWHLGSTRSTESYTVGDLRTNDAHIFGGNLTDVNHDGSFFEAFTKIKDGNKLWITTLHRFNVYDSDSKELRWVAQSWDANGNIYYDTQNPDYKNATNGQYHVAIDRVVVYDLVDPIKVE